MTDKGHKDINIVNNKKTTNKSLDIDGVLKAMETLNELRKTFEDTDESYDPDESMNSEEEEILDEIDWENYRNTTDLLLQSLVVLKSFADSNEIKK